jgi:hypothetical protein
LDSSLVVADKGMGDFMLHSLTKAVNHILHQHGFDPGEISRRQKELSQTALCRICGLVASHAEIPQLLNFLPSLVANTRGFINFFVCPGTRVERVVNLSR